MKKLSQIDIELNKQQEYAHHITFIAQLHTL